MSAPSIPNLLSLRGSGRGGRGRRGAGRGGLTSTGPPQHSPSHDAIIQGTDTDAAVSRLSAVDLGYLQDPFAQFFVPHPGSTVPARRLPIINRGTYTRTKGLDRLIDAFLSSGGERQVVSLGAGTDTRSFRLFSANDGKGISGLTYHEIDFPAVTSKKLGLVRAVPALRSILADPEIEKKESECATGAEQSPLSSSSSWSSHRGLPNGCRYHCHGQDLRSLAKPDAKPLPGLRKDVPTLLVSECCLCYLEVSEAQKVIEYFTNQIPDLAIVLYEPIKPDDPFGRQMVSNLAARRVRMPTLDAYKGIAEQQARLKTAGFPTAKTMTVEDIWNRWIAEEEKERVDGLEGLDEVEEWNLLAGHYAVAWAWRGQGFSGWEGTIAS